MNVVVQNPAGPLNLGVSPDNPYKECPSSTDSDYNTTWVYFGESAVQLDEEDLSRALELERCAGFVRVLTAIDVFMNLLNFVSFGYLFSIIACAVSYVGYHGAMLYRKHMIIGYLTYQCLMTVARIVWMVYVFNNHDNEYLMAITPISALSQLYITSYVWKFYSMLPNFVS